MKAVGKVKEANARAGWRVCAKRVRIPLKQQASRRVGKAHEGGSIQVVGEIAADRKKWRKGGGMLLGRKGDEWRQALGVDA
jgi:hypothetical protein